MSCNQVVIDYAKYICLRSNCTLLLCTLLWWKKLEMVIEHCVFATASDKGKVGANKFTTEHGQEEVLEHCHITCELTISELRVHKR